MLVGNQARRKGRSDIGQGLLGGASPDATILAIHLHPSGTKNWEVTEAVLAWARDVGEGLDELPPEQRKEVLRMVVDEVTVDRDNNVDITLAIPIDDESVSSASQPSPRGGRGLRGGSPRGSGGRREGGGRRAQRAWRRVPSLSLSQRWRGRRGGRFANRPYGRVCGWQGVPHLNLLPGETFSLP